MLLSTWGVALPALQFGDDAQQVASPVGLCGVAGESFVGHVGVVFEGTHRFDDVDVPPFPTPGQLGSPGGCVHERGEIDVGGHSTLLEVGAVAGGEFSAGFERGLRAVEERAHDVGATVVGDRRVGAGVCAESPLERLGIYMAPSG
jgi:hypothetical protein